MKKFSALTAILVSIVCYVSAGQVKLTAIFDGNNSSVILNWNMVNSASRTSYILLKSRDGIRWTQAVKDRMLRIYTDEDIYFFNDRYYTPGKNFYRIRIADAANNTIALSPVVSVNVGGTPQVINANNSLISQNTSHAHTIMRPENNNSWLIYPNPATDILKLVYKGRGDIKGVVNVLIEDAIGKPVIKFRSGSKFTTIEIPISNLQRGAYLIQITVLNDIMINQRFIKQ